MSESAVLRAIGLADVAPRPTFVDRDLSGIPLTPGAAFNFLRVRFNGTLPRLAFLTDERSMSWYSLGCLPWNGAEALRVDSSPFGDVVLRVSDEFLAEGVETGDDLWKRQRFYVVDLNDPSRVFVLRNYVSP